VAKTLFLRDRRWHIQDFVAGLQYAIEHNWIRIPSPKVIRLTEDAFVQFISVMLRPKEGRARGVGCLRPRSRGLDARVGGEPSPTLPDPTLAVGQLGRSGPTWPRPYVRGGLRGRPVSQHARYEG
jgi:hypothetical protein